MILPTEIESNDEETTVIGDVDKFIRDLESGRVHQEWVVACYRSKRMLDELLGS